jgi:hypothetical protein
MRNSLHRAILRRFVLRASLLAAFALAFAALAGPSLAGLEDGVMRMALGGAAAACFAFPLGAVFGRRPRPRVTAPRAATS